MRVIAKRHRVKPIEVVNYGHGDFVVWCQKENGEFYGLNLDLWPDGRNGVARLQNQWVEVLTRTTIEGEEEDRVEILAQAIVIREPHQRKQW